MRVLHLTPTHFSDGSIIGGAERFAWELSRAMASEADVSFLALSDRFDERLQDGVRVLHVPGRPLLDHPLARNPVSRHLWQAIRRSDIVHCHQVHTFLTNAAITFGKLLHRPVFVTDLGGGHPYSPAERVPLLRWASAFLLLSNYSRDLWAALPHNRRPDRLETIYAGVDIDQFRPATETSRTEVLFVGRILPHKGVEHLIDAIAPPLSLRVVGRPYDDAYLAMLRDRAAGKNVTFEADVDDEGLRKRYRSAFVMVLPSVATDWKGRTTNVAELFGLVVVEAMACARPVIVSRTASLPELVDEGVTGFVVRPGDSSELRNRLMRLAADPSGADEMGRAGRLRVEQRYTWLATAQRCLQAYRR